MDAQLAQSKFQQADTLFKQGRHQDALRVLSELNNAFPDSRNVLYPMALCLEKLGQRAEAERLCSILIQKFQDPRAQALMAQLQAAATQSNLYQVPGMDAMDFNVSDQMPSAFGAPPRPAAPQPDSKRGLLIGVGALVAVVAVVAVLAAGAKQGWFAAGPSKIEQLEAKFAEVLLPAKSLAATVDVAADMPKIPIPISVSGTIEYLEKDGRMYMRLEGAASMPPMSFLVVADGESLFQQVDMQGQKMVMKMPSTSDMIAKANPGEIITKLHDAFEMKALPDELFRGKDVWVFELTPKAGAVSDMPVPIPVEAMDHLKLSVDGEALSYLKLEALDKEGASIMSLALMDIRLDAPLAAEKFAYTPPEGVKVMDMSQMGAMGGGMLPFMGQ